MMETRRRQDSSEQFVGFYCWACRYSRPHSNIPGIIKCQHQDEGGFHDEYFGCSYGEPIPPNEKE